MAKFRPATTYGVVPNSILNNSNLSWKAKGLFAYLQSKPTGWKFSKDRIKRDATDGRESTMTGLQELEHAGYLVRNKIQNKRGQWEYEHVLLENPSEGIPASENPTTDIPTTYKERDSKKEIVKKSNGATATPKPCGDTHRSPVGATKETHNKETHKSEHSPALVSELLGEFLTVNPTTNFGNKTQRSAIQVLLNKFGEERTRKIIEYAISVQGKQFAPTITTPYQLKEKLGSLMIFHQRQENKPLTVKSYD